MYKKCTKCKHNNSVFFFCRLIHLPTRSLCVFTCTHLRHRIHPRIFPAHDAAVHGARVEDHQGQGGGMGAAPHVLPTLGNHGNLGALPLILLPLTSSRGVQTNPPLQSVRLRAEARLDQMGPPSPKREPFCCGCTGRLNKSPVP